MNDYEEDVIDMDGDMEDDTGVPPVTPAPNTSADSADASTPALPTPMTLRFEGDAVTSAPATLTKDDATAIANLLRSKHDDLDVIPNSFFSLMNNNSTASGNVSTKASLFSQGVHSSAGALHTSKAALANEADYYDWPIPGTKQKIPVPIFKDLDQIPRWQVLLNGVFEKILNIVNALPTDINPFHGLTDEEATKRIMTLFDPKLLISDLVKLRLSDLVFDGTDFKLVSSKDVFDALRERGFQLASKTTSRQMVEKINRLRMANTTFSGMVRGFTVVKNFENLWIGFTDVFSKHLFTQWEGSSIPTQLLIPLVEPVQLRRFLIERLYLAIKAKEEVKLFGLGLTPISLADTRTVYKFAVALFHGIDMIMKTNSNYLESLTTENEFSRTFIPDDTFWKMQFSPHEKPHNRVTGSKRNADDLHPELMLLQLVVNPVPEEGSRLRVLTNPLDLSPLLLMARHPDPTRRFQLIVFCARMMVIVPLNARTIVSVVRNQATLTSRLTSRMTHSSVLLILDASLMLLRSLLETPRLMVRNSRRRVILP
jgi:hypothetical protein